MSRRLIQTLAVLLAASAHANNSIHATWLWHVHQPIYWPDRSPYIMEWVNNFASQTSGRGYEPSTVEQYLNDHPVDSNDVVHVEDGGWVYADGDRVRRS